MASPTDDLYSRFFDPYVPEQEAARARFEERKKREQDEEAFRARWMSAYRTNWESPDFESIAKQLLLLRDDILGRFWDFYLSSLVTENNRVAWNLAAVTLWHVCRGDKVAIQRGLAHTSMLLNDVAIWHGDMHEVMKFKPGVNWRLKRYHPGALQTIPFPWFCL